MSVCPGPEAVVVIIFQSKYSLNNMDWLCSVSASMQSRPRRDASKNQEKSSALVLTTVQGGRVETKSNLLT